MFKRLQIMTTAYHTEDYKINLGFRKSKRFIEVAAWRHEITWSLTKLKNIMSLIPLTILSANPADTVYPVVGYLTSCTCMICIHYSELIYISGSEICEGWTNLSGGMLWLYHWSEPIVEKCIGASMCVPVCSAYVRSLANTYMPPPTDILRSGVLVKVVSEMIHHVIWYP